MMETTVSSLILIYGIFMTALWIEKGQDLDLEVAKFERIILQQEKLMIEMENEPPVECISVRPYTYDQWVTERPCPPGKRGPLCHMDPTDYE